MDPVVAIYNGNKVDLPYLHKINYTVKYDCSFWTYEVAMMMNNDFDSVSFTFVSSEYRR